MSRTHTIVSKRTTPFVYTKWEKINGQFHQIGKGIVINGGAGIVGGAELLSGVPLSQRRTLVPDSVLTFVDDEALEVLKSIPKFNNDVKRGIIVVYEGKKISQEKGDEIARQDMLEDEHIPTRPITEDEMLRAGGKMTKDGNVNIEDVPPEMSPLKVRRQDAGQPQYVKKRNYESRKRAASERKRASNA